MKKENEVRFVRLSDKGQVVIPSSARKKLELEKERMLLMAQGTDFVIFKKVNLHQYSREYEQIVSYIKSLNKTFQQELTTSCASQTT